VKSKMEAGSLIPPIQEGDIIDNLFIEGLGRQKKDGIGKVDNFVVIVPGTEENKSYRVKIKKVYDRFSFGEIYDQEI